MQSSHAVVLVADLVGYTSMMEEDRDSAIRAVRALRETWFEPAMLAHGGEVLKRLGDGWIVVFDAPAAAVEAALEVQDRLAGEAEVRLRIGLHLGEILWDEEDFYGAGVNLASRIEVEAPPGGVMISQDLAARLPETLIARFRDAGSFRLKNVALPMTLMQWRPTRTGSGDADDVPTIGIEGFAAAPDDRETVAAAEDLRDQLIQRLSQRTGIRVLDDAISGAGGAVYRLRGRVRIAGSRGRVSLSLVLRDSAQPAWSKSYDGDTTDILAFCDRVIDRADTDLRVQINVFDGERVAHLEDDELSVSELRSRAATMFHGYTIAAWERARSLLARALALAPTDPMASAMHAEAVVALAEAHYDTVPAELAASLAVDLDAAVEAAPRSDYIFWARAFYRVYVSGDIAGARADVLRTLLLSPVYTHGYDLLGLIDLVEGDVAACIANIRRSIELTDVDPVLTYRHFLLAVSHICAEEPDAAARAVGDAIQLRPTVRAYHRLLAECHRRAGRTEDAEKSERRAAALAPVPSMLALRPPVPPRERELWSLLAPGAA